MGQILLSICPYRNSNRQIDIIYKIEFGQALAAGAVVPIPTLPSLQISGMQLAATIQSLQSSQTWLGILDRPATLARSVLKITLSLLLLEFLEEKITLLLILLEPFTI